MSDQFKPPRIAPANTQLLGPNVTGFTVGQWRPTLIEGAALRLLWS